VGEETGEFAGFGGDDGDVRVSSSHGFGTSRRR
jgi:hypothetical protein